MGVASRAPAVGAVILALLQGAAAAQGNPSQPGPVATVEQFWRAVLASRWIEAVGLLDLTDLEARRKGLLRAARMPQGRGYNVEDLMRRDPEMPRAAAEYEVRKREKQRAQCPERPFYMF